MPQETGHGNAVWYLYCCGKNEDRQMGEDWPSIQKLQHEALASILKTVQNSLDKAGRVFQAEAQKGSLSRVSTSLLYIRRMVEGPWGCPEKFQLKAGADVHTANTRSIWLMAESYRRQKAELTCLLQYCFPCFGGHFLSSPMSYRVCRSSSIS